LELHHFHARRRVHIHQRHDRCGDGSPPTHFHAHLPEFHTLPSLSPEDEYNAASGGPYGLGCSGTTAAMLGPCIESSTGAIRKLRGRPLREILDGTSKTFLSGTNVIDIDIDL
jgi:hypothetical protein